MTTRWEQTPERRGYGDRFAALIAEGADIDGEARVADALVGRGATVLDAGCGMGRVGAALRARGHQVVAVDLDPTELAQARETFPDLPLVQSRLDDLTPEVLVAAGAPGDFDLIVCVGNVLVFLAEGSEQTVLGRLRALARPGGRLLTGFKTSDGPRHARDYDAEEFVADAVAAGWQVEARYSTYQLDPWTPEGDYLVTLLRA